MNPSQLSSNKTSPKTPEDYSEGNKISLWLSPSPGSNEENSLISLLSGLSSDNKTPKFHPHLTLVSDELIPKFGYTDSQYLETISKGLEEWKSETGGELNLDFSQVVPGDRYYQCVYVVVNPETSTGLVQLHNKMRNVFKISLDQRPVYFPHVSLVYGDLKMDHKKKIIEGLNDKGHLIGNDPTKGDHVKVEGMEGYRPSEVVVFRTNGETKDWRELGRFKI